MSTPIQPPTTLRRPQHSHLPQQHLATQGPPVSPYAQQLPLPRLSTSASSHPLHASVSHALPVPRLSELPYPMASPLGSSGSMGSLPLPMSSPSSAHGLSQSGHASAFSNTHRGMSACSSAVTLPAITERVTSNTSSYADSVANSNASRMGLRTTPPLSYSASHSHRSTHQDSLEAGHRPLNVRDALSYLDQVKIQFSSQPDIYNQFLDIMKEFKSQAIDTPGVIDRVSMLFRGHVDLISGFNTFLPAGYHIECSTDPRDPGLILVTTPSGTTLRRTILPSSTGIGMRAGNSLPRDEDSNPSTYKEPLPGPYFQRHYNRSGPLPPPNQTPLPSLQRIQSPVLHTSHSSTHSPSLNNGGARHTRQQTPPPPNSTFEHDVPPPQTSGRPSVKHTPIEFNHAISFVNRIKARFSDNPDIYRQFLEILQNYQKERRPLQQVIGQVERLFSEAPDLLYEFKNFLPEITGQSMPEYFDVDNSFTSTKRSLYGSPPHHSGFMPPEKKRITDKRKLDSPDDESPEPEPFDPERPTVNMEEIELFDEIRKHIGNKPSYEEFLKVLNLYTRQIITADELIKQVDGFLGGDKELLEWFKKVVGLELKELVIEHPSNAIPKPDLTLCEAVADSPSYRIVPKEWQNQPCSGRDQLCWEVLNDEYVSHPIWASEESGFASSKKNQYEEAMHRCEEERYDYDLNIDANLNTISLLEPIAQRIEKMTAEEKANFRVSPGLGGQSVSIYQRVIKKVYEDERGNDILDMLYNNPARVIPVLLKRLVQKDKEWRKAQQEWNKVWRDMDTKNFYRSLDYQGLTFKSNDRKTMAIKYLMNEIETLHQESTSPDDTDNKTKVVYPMSFLFHDTRIFKDITRLVFSYVEKQHGFSKNDRSKIGTFMRSFIPLFFHEMDAVPDGLDIHSNHEDNDSQGDVDDGDDDDDDEGDEEEDDTQSTSTETSGTGSYSRSSSTGERRKRTQLGADDTSNGTDFLRDVLMKNNENGEDDNDTGTSANAEVDTSMLNEEDSFDQEASQSVEDNGTLDERDDKEPSVDQQDNENALDPLNKSSTSQQDKSEPPSPVPETMVGGQGDDNNMIATAAAVTAPNIGKRTVSTFFCNSAFYCLFRLYHILFERLSKMREFDAKIAADPNQRKKANQVAFELGLYTDRFDDMDLSMGHYQALLDLIDRFFDGELDQSMFEEKARHLFVTEAYTLFTVDKLVQSLIKQIQAVTTEEKSLKLDDLFRSDQSLETTSPRVMAVYRLRAEEVIDSDENLYEVTFDANTHTMTMQILDKGETILESSPQDQYENYVASYLNWGQATEGVDPTWLKPTFLQRTWNHYKYLDKFVVRSRLEYKIDKTNCHMCYTTGSEDAIIRPRLTKARLDDSADRSNSKWQAWLETSPTGWATGVTSETERSTLEAEARALYQ